MKSDLKLILILIAGWVLFTGFIIYYYQTSIKETGKITNFEECVAAGNPIMESYPPRCSANGQNFTQEIKEDGVACTMEAKLCPDGSYVGRTGPSCEFEACPGE